MTDNQDISSPSRFLDQVGRILDQERIGWATIGALAVAYHGLVRASLDADALITLKIFAGGPQDLEDVRGIVQIQGQNIDTELLENLCRNFGPIEENLFKKFFAT